MVINLSVSQCEIAYQLAASGQSIDRICLAIGLSHKEFMNAKRHDMLFATRFSAAQADGCEVLVDRLIDPPDHMSDQRWKMISDGIRWRAAKIVPEKYGERVAVDVGVQVDIRQALNDATRRVLEYRRPELQQDIDTAYEDAPGATIVEGDGGEGVFQVVHDGGAVAVAPHIYDALQQENAAASGSGATSVDEAFQRLID